MSLARFKGVLICSSEEKNYPASNLISDSNKKWKCEECGMDSVYVVLQLENPTKINGIDIGNENSAFIEVAVGRTGWPIEKFKTILVTSSFMTITESRVCENPNRVRCFRKQALMPDVSDEKWDLVKVTCTQGFNKHVKFGLSFIKVYTSDATISSTSSTSVAVSAPTQAKTVSSPKEQKCCDERLGLPKNSVFAQFRMRGDSSDSDKEETSSSLFSKWKQRKESPIKISNISSAAAIRQASESVSELEKCTKINYKIETPSSKPRKPVETNSDDSKKQRLDRYRAAILYDSDDENTSKPKQEKLIEIDKARLKQDVTNSPQSSQSPSQKIVQEQRTKPDLSSQETQSSQTQPSQSNTETSSDEDVRQPWRGRNKRLSTSNDGNTTKRSRISSSPARDTPKKEDISQILRGVVFVISGIQNPERSNMRDKGLKMGAKYKPDWDHTCTHLVSAFKNTPKYQQVNGQGIIVNSKWINDCFNQKKKMPWQDYSL